MNVKKLLSFMEKHLWDACLKSITLTVDRGYGSPAMLREITEMGVNCLAIMPDNVLKFHPFVAKIRFNVDHNEEESDNP